MTQINRKLTRETSTIYRGRELVIDLHAGYLELRPKGKRKGFAVDYGTVFDLAMKIEARKEMEIRQREKQQQRQQRSHQTKRSTKGGR